MDNLPVREIITYEYQFYDTPRFCVMDETWELYDVFPAKWNPGNKVLIFRREFVNKSATENGEG